MTTRSGLSNSCGEVTVSCGGNKFYLRLNNYDSYTEVEISEDFYKAFVAEFTGRNKAASKQFAQTDKEGNRYFQLKNGVVLRVASLKEAYVDGFTTGLEWTFSYRPGGPYVSSTNSDGDPIWVSYCEQQERFRQEWLRGFDEGRQRRNDIINRIETEYP